MNILAVDIGTGTQDILLFDSRKDVENSFKMVLPSPTMITHRRLKEATRRGQDVALTGVTMGGGPSHWAAEDHLKAGYRVFATEDAARSFNDDLEVVKEFGVILVSEDEAARLPAEILQIELKDFNFDQIARAFSHFDVSLHDLDAIAVAVFDHGAAPPGYSDRQFRFDYIKDRISTGRQLSVFSFLAQDIPEIMTRMKSVVLSSGQLDAELVLMDTAPAAVLGAMQDSMIRSHQKMVVANIGNFHTIAFRWGKDGIEGVFEHHTGMLDAPKLDGLLSRMADGSLLHEEVFMDHGHGALLFESSPLGQPGKDFFLAVTGPRWVMMEKSILNPYFATPYGDMMMAGCFGLLKAVGDRLPEYRLEIDAALAQGREKPPWELA